MDTWRKDKKPGDLAAVQGRLTAAAIPVFGAYSKILAPLDAKAASLNSDMSQLTVDWENAKAGVRGVSQQASQARLAEIHGGTIANPNASINLRALARGLRSNLLEENATAAAAGQKPMLGPNPKGVTYAMKNAAGRTGTVTLKPGEPLPPGVTIIK